MKTNTITAVPRLRFPDFISDVGWKIEKLEEVTHSISSGKDNKVSNGDYLLYGSTGIIGETDKASHIGSYILVARVGANAGLLNYVTGKFGVSDNTLVISVKKTKANINFIYYFLTSFRLNKLVFGSGQPLITGKQLKSIEFGLPNIAEQQKIADCLSSLDDSIDAEIQQLESLKVHKAGLLQNLFPAEDETVPNYRFPEFENNVSWEEKSLNSICHFVRGPFGGALKKDIFVKDGYAVYEQSHAIYGAFDSFRYYINQEKFDELKRFEVKPDDLIMSCSGTMGRF